MDQSAVDASPDNVTSRTHYPLTELRILTWVLRTITEYAHLSFEVTGIVGAIFSFWQPLRFAQALPSLEVFRILFLFSVLHFFLRVGVGLESRYKPVLFTQLCSSLRRVPLIYALRQSG
jgi:predicted membrane protein